MSSRTNPDNELGLNVSFYIENASTGRFRRCLGDSDRDTRSSSSTIPTRQNTVVAEDESDGVTHHMLPVMTKAAFICFLFLQGILSGLSLSAVYEALTPQRTEEFFAQYSAARANEIRRYFFIGITLCATGSLCSINKNEATQVLYSMIGGSSRNSTTKASSNSPISSRYFGDQPSATTESMAALAPANFGATDAPSMNRAKSAVMIQPAFFISSPACYWAVRLEA